MVDYKFSGTEREIPNPEGLSNTERAMLRELAEPGAPLWKIFRAMVDYGEGLKQALVGVDLTDPDQIRSAQKVQATIIATRWVQDVFEASLSDVEAPTEETT